MQRLMERLFDQTTLIKLLKDGLKKPNPKNPDRMMWTLEDLDEQLVRSCKQLQNNPAFPQGYQGVEYRNLARLKEPPPPPAEEKVELTNPKDYPTHF